MNFGGTYENRNIFSTIPHQKLTTPQTSNPLHHHSKALPTNNLTCRSINKRSFFSLSETSLKNILDTTSATQILRTISRTTKLPSAVNYRLDWVTVDSDSRQALTYNKLKQIPGQSWLLARSTISSLHLEPTTSFIYT